jgi:dipeptidyl-peptidase 4
MSLPRGAWPLLLLLVGCPSAAPEPVEPSVMPKSTPSPPSFADASASPVTFARMADFPPPGWQIPRHVRLDPSGKTVTYLKAESGGEQMALFALDLATKEHRVLLRASDVVGDDKPMSREEELRRERQRKRIAGVTAYDWAEKAPVMVLPLGGDVYLRDETGKLRQLTDGDEPEIDPKLCADGTRVAFARGRELFVVEVATGKEKALTKDAPEGVTRGQSDFNAQEEFSEPSGFWWSPSCDRIAFVEVDERGVDRIPIMGYRGGTDLQHLRYPRAGRDNPKVRLGVVDIASGKTTFVALPKSAHFADDAYLGRVAFSDDGATLYFQRLARDQRHLALVAADARSGEARHLVEETDPAWLDFAEMTPIGGDFLWVSIREGGHHHLERRSASTGAVVRTLTSGPFEVFAIAGVDAKSNRVLFVSNESAPLDRQLYVVALDGGPRQRITQAPGVHEIAGFRAGHGFVDIHSAQDRLPQAEIYDAQGKISGGIPVEPDGDLESLGIDPVEIVEIGADPTLYGALLTPAKLEPGRRYPVIVMVYGGPGVQTILNEYNPRLMWQHLADRGFVVFQLDNRGSKGRGHAFESPIHRDLGRIELEDQLKGVEHLKTLDFVDPARIGIYGHSYGGYLAAMAILARPDVFPVAVSGSPVTDWSLYDTGYTERYMSTPADNAEGYTRSSLVPLAPNLKGKLFLIHALMDENVHFEHTAKLIDALVAADKDFDLLVFPGERHGYRSPAARQYAYRRVVDYFVAHL